MDESSQPERGFLPDFLMAENPSRNHGGAYTLTQTEVFLAPMCHGWSRGPSPCPPALETLPSSLLSSAPAVQNVLDI